MKKKPEVTYHSAVSHIRGDQKRPSQSIAQIIIISRAVWFHLFWVVAHDVWHFWSTLKPCMFMLLLTHTWMDSQWSRIIVAHLVIFRQPTLTPSKKSNGEADWNKITHMVLCICGLVMWSLSTLCYKVIVSPAGCLTIAYPAQLSTIDNLASARGYLPLVLLGPNCGIQDL